MDFKQIQELIKMINKSNIGELTIEQKDFRLTIKQKEEHITQVLSAPAQPAPVYTTAPQPSVTQQAPQTSSGSTNEKPKTESGQDNLLMIRSPMIGTFYRRQAPDKPNLADIGTEVSQGQVVCIIEAMKLFNEIESEVQGKIVKVLVEDASPVEFDQPLFLVEPK